MGLRWVALPGVLCRNWGKNVDKRQVQEDMQDLVQYHLRGIDSHLYSKNYLYWPFTYVTVLVIISGIFIWLARASGGKLGYHVQECI